MTRHQFIPAPSTVIRHLKPARHTSHQTQEPKPYHPISHYTNQHPTKHLTSKHSEAHKTYISPLTTTKMCFGLGRRKAYAQNRLRTTSPPCRHVPPLTDTWEARFWRRGRRHGGGLMGGGMGGGHHGHGMGAHPVGGGSYCVGCLAGWGGGLGGSSRERYKGFGGVGMEGICMQ